MNTKHLFVGLILLLGMGIAAQAQPVISGFGNVATAFGALNDATRGVAVGGGLDFRYIMESGLSIGAKGEFSSYNTEPSELGDGNVNIAPVNIMVDYFFRRKGMIPWVGIATGPTFLNFRYVTSPDNNFPVQNIRESESAFNIAPTVGLILGISAQARFYANIRYDIIFRSGENALGQERKNFSYMPFTLGLMFSLRGPVEDKPAGDK